MSPTPQPIRVLSVPQCPLCKGSSAPLYSGLTDRSWAAPGKWNLVRCQDGNCRLIWLDPMPTEEDVGLAYQGYYTHNQPEPGPSLIRDTVWGLWMSYLGLRYGYNRGVGPAWRKPFGLLALLHPGGRDELDAAAMYLPAPPQSARVLDVGCGSGVLLARMKQLGWEAEGVEVDPGGVEAARKRGVTVHHGTLQAQKYPDNYFDAVHSAHVIEHVHDPVGLLTECRRILKPGGTLVFITPNTAGRGHRLYGSAWLNLDPPRHLILFSPKNLRAAAEQAGLTVTRLDTSVRTAWVYGALSRAIQRTGRAEMSELGRPNNLAYGIAHQLRQRLARMTDAEAGDELRLFATK